MEILRTLTFYSAVTFIIDFLLIWLIVYVFLNVIRSNERVGQILKGLFIIIVGRYIANIIGLNMIERFFAEFMNWGFLVIIIIFAPEIRSALENVGKSTVFNRLNGLKSDEKSKLIEELVDATTILSNSNTGALITLQMRDSLKEYSNNGVKIDALATKELIGNIFYPKAPLHDGAIIIVGNMIESASVFFPSSLKEVNSHYGARHRAALAISEISDALTIVVSEETGDITIAMNGELRKVSEFELRQILDALILIDTGETNEKIPSVFQTIFDNVSESEQKVTSRFIKKEVLENGERVEIYYRRYGGDSNGK